MTRIAPLGFGRGVVAAVDDGVEVAHGDLGHAVEFGEIERGDTCVRRREERGQAEGGEIAHGRFVSGAVLDDLGAEVGRLDATEVLLVAFAVGRVFVQHEGRAGFELRREDATPEVLGGDGAAGEVGGGLVSVSC